MNDEINYLARQTSRANTIARAVTTIHHKAAVSRVRAFVEDAGSTWAGLVALTAKAKVRAVLNEPPNAAVVQYHATSSTHDWPSGSADNALPRVARRVARRIGPLLPDTAMLYTVFLLIDLAGVPGHLSPEVAANIRGRMRWVIA